MPGIPAGNLIILINQKINAMNAQFLKEQWSLIRDKLREKYPNLTDNDLAYVAGSEEEVFDRVERRTGLKRQEVESTLLNEISFA
jgi:hemerythrin superfamily protein